jgi:hypothetical protein
LTFAALFPKVNFSWIAVDRQSNETSPVFGALTLLRPRVALGTAGVQPSPGDQLRLLGAPFEGTALLSDTLLLVKKLGNTQLRPERSSEVEGGFEAEMWHGRVTADITHARKMRHDAIIPIPVAPSVNGVGASINANIGEVQNTSTELQWSVQPLQGARLNWTVGGTFSHNDNKVVRLDQNALRLVQSSNGDASVNIGGVIAAVGYPLFGRWTKPILGYADLNQDGIIQLSEIRLGDTAVFLGRTEPATTAAVTTDFSVWQGRLGVHANLSHQGAYSQLNAAGKVGSTLTVANDPTATLAQQAAYVAAICSFDSPSLQKSCGSTIGLVQTVSSWRFQSLSINGTLPASVAQWFHGRTMRVALQGSNLALWTNYRGKDPNVNALPNGNGLADVGQVVQPRTWSLQFTLGN